MKEEKKENVKLPLLAQDDATVEQLLKAGVHFGHQTQRWHPSMKQYIYTSRDGVHIIDLIKTIDKFNEALTALYEYAVKGEVLFVGTKTQVKDVIKGEAIRSKSHFVVNRWPGGLLTNYLVTRKSIKKLNDYVKGFKEGIENRTKKELLKMKEDLRRLDILYGGVKTFNKKPACIVVVDPKKSAIAVREAKKMGIPVIAIVDTNSTTENVDHIIPANDDAVHSVEFLVKRLADVVLLANQGVGAEFSEIDFEEVETNIQNMSKMIEEKRHAPRVAGETDNSKFRVIRVSREQAQKSGNFENKKK